MRDNPAYHGKNKRTPDGVRRIRLPAEASTLCLLHEKTLAGFLVVTCGTTLHITEKTKGHLTVSAGFELPAEASTLCLLHEKTLAGFLVVTCGTTLRITGKTKGHLTVSFCFWRATQDSNLRPTGS